MQLPQPDLSHPHVAYLEGDDGPHPSFESSYFEWWYYDATFEDGSSATVALYAAGMFRDKAPPGVLVNILDPAGKAHTSYQDFSQELLSFGSPGEVTVASSSIKKGEGGVVRVQAFGKNAAGDPISVELTFTPTMPGFKLGDGAVRFDGKTALGWVVPMPRANVEGTVRVGAEERRVKGLGYHDHNWGELNLKDTMGYWYWGRVASKDLTLIYADVHFREELGVQPMRVVVAGDEKKLLQVFDDMEIEPLPEKPVAEAARDVPGGLTLKSGKAAMRLTEKKIVEADDLSKTMGGMTRFFARFRTKPAYVRTLCDYTWACRLDGLPRKSEGAALVEYMYVWKK